MSTETKAILFYDGDCGLCSRSVGFLMKRDRDKVLHYAPIQGHTAADLLDPKLRASLSTVIYRRSNGEVLTRSDAVLAAVIDIRNGWSSFAKPSLWIPRFLRDAVYDWVATHRQKFFPKESCPFPTPDQRQRLLP